MSIPRFTRVGSLRRVIASFTNAAAKKELQPVSVTNLFQLVSTHFGIAGSMLRSVWVYRRDQLIDDENGLLTFTQLLEHLCDFVPGVLGRRDHTIPWCFCLGNRRHGRCIGQ